MYLPPSLRNRKLPVALKTSLIPFSCENRTYQNVWDTTKAVPEEKFISLNTHTRKAERSQTNDLSLHLKKLEKEEQMKFNVSRIKKTVKIGVEINEIKMTNVRNENGVESVTTDSTDIKG